MALPEEELGHSLEDSASESPASEDSVTEKTEIEADQQYTAAAEDHEVAEATPEEALVQALAEVEKYRDGALRAEAEMEQQQSLTPGGEIQILLSI